MQFSFSIRINSYLNLCLNLLSFFMNVSCTKDDFIPFHLVLVGSGNNSLSIAKKCIMLSKCISYARVVS